MQKQQKQESTVNPKILKNLYFILYHYTRGGDSKFNVQTKFNKELHKPLDKNDHCTVRFIQLSQADITHHII